MTLPLTARRILDRLLDQHEQPERRRVCRVRLDRRKHPEYFSTEAADDRLETHGVLLAVSTAVHLEWQRWEEGNLLAWVDLVPGGAIRLYELLGRTPCDVVAAAYRDLVGSFQPAGNWFDACLEWARTEARLTDLGDPAACRDTLRAVAAIACLEGSLLERTLSVRLFSDSKRFEAIRNAVGRLVARFSPGAAELAPDEALRAAGVDRAPEYVPVAGPLTVGDLEVGAMPGGVALPSSALSGQVRVRTAADRVVTIENLTTFAAWQAVRPADSLVVLTGGFPGRAVLRLLQAIGRPVYHWGDLDAGGYGILAYLRRKLGPVAAIGLEAWRLEAHAEACRPLTEGDRRRLAALAAAPELMDLRADILTLLDRGQKLEQEAIAPDSVVSALRGPAAGR